MATPSALPALVGGLVLGLGVPPAAPEDELTSGEPVTFELNESEPLREFRFDVGEDSLLTVYSTSEAETLLVVENAAGDVLGTAPGGPAGSAYLELSVPGGEEAWVRVECEPPCLAAAVELKLTAFAALSDEQRRVLAAADQLSIQAGLEYEVQGPLAARETLAAARERLGRLPLDHPEVRFACYDVAAALSMVGEAVESAELALRGYETLQCFLPADHRDLHVTRGALGIFRKVVGDLPGALVIQQECLRVCEQVRSHDDPELLFDQLHLGSTLSELGDCQRALDLEMRVLEVRSRTLPDDHFDLQDARQNVAITLRRLGKVATARELEEKVLKVRRGTLPEGHPQILDAQMNLAITLRDLGDLVGASDLLEDALEGYSRMFPPDHRTVQFARRNLANNLKGLGEYERARVLAEEALNVLIKIFPEENPAVQTGRENLATVLTDLGEFERARELHELAIRVYARTLPDDHEAVQHPHHNLGKLLLQQGEPAAALVHFEQALAGWAKAYPDNHAFPQSARSGVALCSALIGDWTAAHRHARDLSLGITSGIESRGLALSPREIEALAVEVRRTVNVALGVARLSPVDAPLLEETTFEAVEATRACGASLRRVLRTADSDDEHVLRLRDEIRRASFRTTRVARAPATGQVSSAESPGHFTQTVRDRDAAERELNRRLSDLARTQDALPSAKSRDIAASLGPQEAAVAYLRYVFNQVDPDTGRIGPRVDYYLAYVLRGDRPLLRVELGPADDIDAAVEAWRGSILVAARSRGVTPVAPGSGSGRPTETSAALRELIFDPLRSSLDGVRRVVIVGDDALHLVPFGVLQDGDRLLGDTWRFLHRVTLKELTVSSKPPHGTHSLLALGAIDYTFEAPGSVSPVRSRSAEVFSGATTAVLRSSSLGTFTALPETEVEVLAVGKAFDQAFGEADSPRTMLTGPRATRGRFEEAASSARYLHLATHGYFAEASVSSLGDDRLLDPVLGIHSELNLREQVRGLSPMVLCGLAFAGANGDPNEYGYIGGVMTGEELAQLDLSRCELCVLSACDTNVGVRRAGQGIASLQQALFSAGIRASITSLWRVPDAATRELMAEFYRRWWLLGESRHDALWNAQQKLRHARDGSGNLRYALQDWAAWVLTGDPD